MASATMSATSRRSDATFAWLMSAPAFLGLLDLFNLAVCPGYMVLSFTNQRLLSPNPTEGVGVRNYDRLLGITVLTWNR